MDATLTVDTSVFSQVDRRFFAVLFGSMLLHGVAAGWVARQPHVVVEEPPYVERPRDRVTLPPLVKIPKSFPEPSQKPPGGPGGKKPSGSGPGLGALLATAIDDLKGPAGDVEAALEGVQRGPLDTTLLASRRERGPNEAQAIGPIVTTGVGAVGLGEHQGVGPPRGRVEDVVIEELPELPDPQVFLRFINARRSALAACYERELKRHPSLSGKVSVELTVTPDGRAREVRVEPGSLQSAAVAECIETLVRRWVFPVKPDDEVPLQFPVLFHPAR